MAPKKPRKIEVPKNPVWDINKDRNISNDLPPLHQLYISCGHKNSGKTLSTINLLKFYKDEGACDMIILISPTYEANKKIFEPINDRITHVLDPIEDAGSAKKAKQIVEEEAETYVQWLQDLKRFKEFKKKVISQGFDMDDIVQMSDFWNDAVGDFMKPEHWLGRKPVIHIVLDDVLGTPLLNKNLQSLVNLSILHRHIGSLQPEEDGALGASLYFITQSYKSKSGSIPKSIRENTSTLIVFWTYNQNMLDAIAEEASGNISYDAFFDKYRKAFDTDDPKHSFLLIDFKKNLFKRRFDEII